MALTLDDVKKALGETGKKLSDDEVMTLANNLQVLAYGWLESYERAIFKGRTVNELINDMIPNLSKDQLESQKKWRKSIREFNAKNKKKIKKAKHN